uniref:Uncharacterized protein n=1 Tax=Anguilla anguilla TaxID=7936 RepID=A0A0E9WN12_ANGAN
MSVEKILDIYEIQNVHLDFLNIKLHTRVHSIVLIINNGLKMKNWYQKRKFSQFG